MTSIPHSAQRAGPISLAEAASTLPCPAAPPALCTKQQGAAL